ECILAMRARLAGVEVGVRQIEPTTANLIQRRSEAGARVLEALGEEPLRLGRRRLEAEWLQRTDLRHQPVEERHQPREPSGTLVLRPELGLELLAGVAIDERVLLHAGRQPLDLLALVAPRDSRD